jgi:two-component system LytT family sensor kinase
LKLVRTAISFLLGISLYYYLQWGSGDHTVTDFYRAIVSGVYLATVDAFWRLMTRKLDVLVSWKSQFKSRFLLGVLAQFLLIFLVPWLVFQWYEIALDLLLKFGIVAFFLVLLTAVVDFTIYSFNYYSSGQIKSIQIQREQLELQYEALRTQLSPHYLFNSLNTISSLISGNPKPAEQFARRLVQTYQYIIQSRDKKLVPIKEEVDFVKAYMYLLKIRFDESIVTSINIHESIMSHQIPPLTLQILIENAVKHNFFSKEEPLVVSIDTDQNGNLIVRNDNRKKEELVDSFKIGLENIRKRYGFFTQEPIRVSDKQVFQVTLPLIPKSVAA